MRVHPHRDVLLAEVHARPSTPIAAPMLVSRIAALTGPTAADSDRAYMAALCRRLGRDVPAEDARWCTLDGGEWQLRWERHSEFSSWTFLRPAEDMTGTAYDDVPREWLDDIPGEVLVRTTLEVTEASRKSDAPHMTIGTSLMDGAARLYSDLRADPAGMTRMQLEMHDGDPILAGRLALTLLEIETYRMMALLAFPIAGEAAAELTEVEERTAQLAERLGDDLGLEDDRNLLAGIVALSGRMEGLSARTNFRFGAARAYYDIVLGRTASLHEAALPGMQTLGEFLDRRLGPAMRTCASVEARERAVIERIARAGQMLNIRVELVAQAINADLLRSMDSRARAQLRLQRTVEGLSVAAISYYALSLLGFLFSPIERHVAGFDARLATAIAVPVVVAIVWLLTERVRRSIERGAG